MKDMELVFPAKAHEEAAAEYFQEHIRFGENTMHGDSGLDEAKSYDGWLEKINKDIDNEIHAFIFFAVRKMDNKLIGTINIRYPYEDFVQVKGHIGYGIRPSERKKGYGSAMLNLALEHCKKVGLEKVLITCDKSNIASAKTILKCSGLFESETLQQDGEFLQRYWIKL